MDITLEAERGEPVENRLRETQCGKRGNIVTLEAKILQRVQEDVQAAGNEVIALRRKAPDKEAKNRILLKPQLKACPERGERMEIGEEPRIVHGLGSPRS